MNNKITLPALVALLALKSGLTKEKSEEFLREFFRLISETLKEGEGVKIKALGTFKIMSVETRKSVNVTNGEEIIIPGHNRIVFVASREIADEINAPFSMFDSVELNPEAEEEIMASLTDQPLHEEKESALKQEPAVEVTPEPEIEKNQEVISEEKEEKGLEAAEQPSENIASEIIEQPAEIAENVSECIEEPEEMEIPESEIEISERKGKGRMRFVMGFVSGLVLAMLLGAAGYYFFIYKNGMTLQEKNNEVPVQSPTPNDSINKIVNEPVEIINEAASVLKDTLAISEVTPEKEKTIADTQPSDKVVKDVIGPHNYLTTMAQRHYGDYNLWAFIYEENKSFLGHPDRIKPGTEVVVPPLSKYGIDPKNPDDVKKAKQLGLEIYKRYK
ncbi:MAG: HU family DNA-binding protein [Muribaculaceae bacterium]|nr:HU family DNA-binding protein [Muribaculaceae bacterium]